MGELAEDAPSDEVLQKIFTFFDSVGGQIAFNVTQSISMPFFILYNCVCPTRKDLLAQ